MGGIEIDWSSIKIGGVKIFCPKEWNKKIDKIHKDF